MAVVEARPAAHVNARLQSSIPREDQPGPIRQSRAESDQVYEAIARALPDIFTAGDASARMQWQDKRPAQRVIRAWLDDGRAEEVRLGRYRLT